MLNIVDVVNISFGTEIFMCERCYQNMTTVQNITCSDLVDQLLQ